MKTRNRLLCLALVLTMLLGVMPMAAAVGTDTLWCVTGGPVPAREFEKIDDSMYVGSTWTLKFRYGSSYDSGKEITGTLTSSDKNIISVSKNQYNAWVAEFKAAGTVTLTFTADVNGDKKTETFTKTVNSLAPNVPASQPEVSAPISGSVWYVIGPGTPTEFGESSTALKGDMGDVKIRYGSSFDSGTEVDGTLVSSDENIVALSKNSMNHWICEMKSSGTVTLTFTADVNGDKITETYTTTVNVSEPQAPVPQLEPVAPGEAPIDGSVWYTYSPAPAKEFGKISTASKGEVWNIKLRFGNSFDSGAQIHGTLTSSDENVVSVQENDYGDWVAQIKANGASVLTITADVNGDGINEIFTMTLLVPVSNPFTDVRSNDYYCDAVIWALTVGVTTGLTETTFGPQATCTRAQAVTFLWRAMGSPEPVSTANPFTDVASSDYFYKPVLWAVEQGITNGTSATTFSPNDTVTRGHTITFLYRAMGKPAAEGKMAFGDVTADAYYYAPVLWASNNGVAPTSGSKFYPTADCPRAQIVYFIYNALNQ